MEEKRTQLNDELINARFESNDRFLLKLEVVIGVVSVFYFLSSCLILSIIKMPIWASLTIVIPATITFLWAMFYCLKIEQIAGYYQCNACHHRYVPTYWQVLFALHFGRTRRMRCPKCGLKTWNRKVLKK